MSDRPRYRLRSNSIALTRLQWWIVGVAAPVGVFGLGLGLTGVIPSATGGGIAGLAALISSGVLVSAGSHQP